MFSGKVLTGVRSPPRARGKTSSSLKINETGASLNVLTYKIKKESCYIFSNNKLRYIETSKISAAN